MPTNNAPEIEASRVIETTRASKDLRHGEIKINSSIYNLTAAADQNWYFAASCNWRMEVVVPLMRPKVEEL